MYWLYCKHEFYFWSTAWKSWVLRFHRHISDFTGIDFISDFRWAHFPLFYLQLISFYACIQLFLPCTVLWEGRKTKTSSMLQFPNDFSVKIIITVLVCYLDGIIYLSNGNCCSWNAERHCDTVKRWLKVLCSLESLIDFKWQSRGQRHITNTYAIQVEPMYLLDTTVVRQKMRDRVRP